MAEIQEFTLYLLQTVFYMKNCPILNEDYGYFPYAYSAILRKAFEQNIEIDHNLIYKNQTLKESLREYIINYTNDESIFENQNEVGNETPNQKVIRLLNKTDRDAYGGDGAMELFEFHNSNLRVINGFLQ